MENTNWIVVKHDGVTKAPFDDLKLFIAVHKAVLEHQQTYGVFTHEQAERVVSGVIQALTTKYGAVSEHVDAIPVEEIQSTTEETLMRLGFYDVAKTFMLYRYVRCAKLNPEDRKTSGVDNDNAKLRSILSEIDNLTIGSIDFRYPLEPNKPRIRDPHAADRWLGKYLSSNDCVDLITVLNAIVSDFTTRQARGESWPSLDTLDGIDTFLAPFVVVDDLPIGTVCDCIRNFMWALETNAGYFTTCVPLTYECLTPTGWKHHNELVDGEPIFVVDVNTGTIGTDSLFSVTTNTYTDTMIEFRYNGVCEFMTTKDHRMVIYDPTIAKLRIGTAMWMYDTYRYVRVPTFMTDPASILIPSFNTAENNKAVASTVVYDKYTPYINPVTPYDNARQVWCPTTKTGTFICRTENGRMFVTGNCANGSIHMDGVIPSAMLNDKVLIGGKRHPTLRYAECQSAANMIACTIRTAKAEMITMYRPQY